MIKIPMNIRLVHILTEPEEEREVASIKSLSPLGAYKDISYIPQVNERYMGDAWKNPPALTQSPRTNHGPGHYGAFQSFKKAIESNFTEDVDALILCECDCILLCSLREFVDKAKDAISFSIDNDIPYISFGSRYVGGYLQSPEVGKDPKYPDFYITNKIILAHCVMIPKHSRSLILDLLKRLSWDSPDIWFNEALWKAGKSRFGIVRDRLAVQHEGFSLIDNVWKASQ